MVHAHEGQAPREGVALGGREPDEQGANETRSAGDRDAVDRGIGRIEPGVEQGPSNDGADRGDVGPSGQLGDDAPEGPVLVDRGFDDRGVDMKVLINDGSRRFVATRLDAEDQTHHSSVRGGAQGPSGRSAHRISASSLVRS